MDDAREAYWHEAEPRIIVSGWWQQDEFGDVTYMLGPRRPRPPGRTGLTS